jgi:uncharacterized membrane protein
MPPKPTRRKVEGVKPASRSGKPAKTPATGGIQVRKSVIIDRPRSDLYGYWRRFENLAHFMTNVQEVHELDNQRSHWKVKGPAGKSYEWDAVIIRDLPADLISWRSTAEADVDNAGSVQFREAPGGRGTQVTVTLTYNPPGGAFGSWVAMLFGKEPSQQLSQDLRRFKALMETGEIPRSDLSGAPAYVGIKEAVR